MNFTNREKKRTFFRLGDPSSGSLAEQALGHYILRRLIGRGATGQVYLAEDQRLLRQVALKIILSEYLSQADAKVAAHLFRREAQAIALLNHPNILPLFDFGQESIEGMMLFYLVFPFCPAGSLKDWLQHRPGGALLSPQELLPLLQEAADALEYAHSQGIVHCDVKPANFLIRSRRVTSDQPDLLLADFSIARLAQWTTSVSQTVRGTPSYMSPEQWRGRPVPASDQYGLAGMAYELLTGSPPFRGTAEQLMYHHLIVLPPPPSAINGRIPPALDAVILQALAKQPEARFPSMTAFADAFHQVVQTAAHSPEPQLASTSSPVPSAASANPPVSLSPPAGAKETPHLTKAHLLQASDIHVTLHLSSSEARTGGDRTLRLPNGQQAKVTVPAGVYDGQIIRLPRYLEPSSPLARKKDLVVTIAVTSTVEPPVVETTPGLAPVRFQWKTLLFLGLVLLVLLASIVGLFSFNENAGTKSPSPATATAIQARLQATYSAATATAVAHATATVQFNATAIVTYNPYDAELKTLTLYEPLEQNSASKWEETSGGCFFGTGGYHAVNVGQATTAQVCAARNTNLGSLAVEVQMKTIRGTGGGLIVRLNGSNFYYFRISQDRTYALLVCTGSPTSCHTLTSHYSSWINPGQDQANLVAVVAKQSSITVYVNTQYVDSASDTTSSQGQIGVGADPSSEVVFSSIKVWTT